MQATKPIYNYNNMLPNVKINEVIILYNTFSTAINIFVLHLNAINVYDFSEMDL